MVTLAAAGVGAAASVGSSLLNNYFGKSNQSASLSSQYKYAKRYALNSPSWNVEGLRNAGINPILAYGGSAPTSNWSPNSNIQQPSGSTWDPNILGLRHMAKETELLDEQIEGQRIRNDNERKNMGLSGRDATIIRIAAELGLTPDKVRSLFGFDMPETKPPDDRNTYEKLLNLKPGQKISPFLFNRPSYSSPLVRVEKPVEKQYIRSRFGAPAANEESYKAWLAHPSNAARRSHTWSENEYLFHKDVGSGLWRKKKDGKYGYR